MDGFRTPFQNQTANSGRTAAESAKLTMNWYNSVYDKLHNLVTTSYNLNKMVFWR
jgi:hypothetical protein